jgi:hypothetical protein
MPYSGAFPSIMMIPSFFLTKLFYQAGGEMVNPMISRLTATSLMPIFSMNF